VTQELIGGVNGELETGDPEAGEFLQERQEIRRNIVEMNFA